MKFTNKLLIAFIILLLISALPTYAATKYSVTGNISGADGYTAILVMKSGAVQTATIGSSGKFKFTKLSLSQLNGASIQLSDAEGRYAGMVVLGGKGSKVGTSFKGKAPTKGKVHNLGNITLLDGYAKLKAGKLAAKFYTKRTEAVNGRPIGAGSLGVTATSQSAHLAGAIKVKANDLGADSDLDGVPDSIDADDDGDLILDSADPDSAGSDTPYTGLYLDFRKAINSNVRNGLSEEVIDSIIGGENVFSLTFFYSLPTDSTVDGGHVMCADSLTYCRPNTPVAYYGGVTESSSDFRNHPWSELLTADGYPKMEKIQMSGGSAIVASIQPRVGRDQFRPGDMYQISLTSGTTEVSSRTMALAPYFVSVPAIKEYDAGFGPVTVDYGSISPTDGSIPGGSPGDPITLSPSGTLKLTFWRPQRSPVRSEESGYIDQGNMNYGAVIESLQASCAGLYTDVSTDLVEADDALGTGGSPFPYQGAQLYPLVDQMGDRAADSGNTVTFTVDLKTCLSRASGTPGTFAIDLTAAGQLVTGGQSAATEMFYVAIP